MLNPVSIYELAAKLLERTEIHIGEFDVAECRALVRRLLERKP